MTLTHSRPWTPREDDLLRRDWKKRPTVEIALLLDRSINGVQARAIRLGLSVKRHHLADHEADFRRLHALGYSDREIADLLGLPRKITWRWRQQLNLPPACPQHTGALRHREQAAQRREAHARAQGWSSWTHWATSRRRLKAQYAFAGCISQAQALICRLLRDAGPEGLTSMELLRHPQGIWTSLASPSCILRRLYRTGTLSRSAERVDGKRWWRYALAGPPSRRADQSRRVRRCGVGC